MRACNSQGACRKSENIFEVIYRQCPRPLAVLKSGRFFGGYARPHNGPLITLGEAVGGGGEVRAKEGRRQISALSSSIPDFCFPDPEMQFEPIKSMVSRGLSPIGCVGWEAHNRVRHALRPLALPTKILL